MPITLGLNLSSLKAQRQLGKTNDNLSQVFERLSSGQRINRASDDAAGLAIAESLNADARVLTQGVRNISDGISILNVADGALTELTNITFRLTELAEQAANGILGDTQRAALDEEAQALKDEYFRIAKSTEFNGRNLFEGDYGKLSLQAGYDVITGGLGGAIGDGTFGSAVSIDVGGRARSLESGDFNGDGIADFVTANYLDDTVSVMLGNEDGSYSTTLFSTDQGPSSVVVADLNNDGVLDFSVSARNEDTVTAFLGNGDGNFTEGRAFTVGDEPVDLAVGDFNGDGINDLVTSNYADGTISLLIGRGDGTYDDSVATAVGGFLRGLTSGDFDGDGKLDIAVAGYGDDFISVLLGDGDGGLSLVDEVETGGFPTDVKAGDLNGDGILDLVITPYDETDINIAFGNGDGTFSEGNDLSYPVGDGPNTVELGDVNGDGALDIVVGGLANGTIDILVGDGNGEFSIGDRYSVGNNIDSISLEDYDGDGVLDILSTGRVGNTVSLILGNTTDGIAPLLDFSLHSLAEARQALSQFTNKLDDLSIQRGELGAFQSRVEVASKVLDVTAENYKSAESRIRDADIAQESANLVRLQILQQAATSVLSQANQQPQIALQLLSGI